MERKQLKDVIAGRKVIRADMVPWLARGLGVGVMELFTEDEEQKGA